MRFRTAQANFNHGSHVADEFGRRLLAFAFVDQLLLDEGRTLDCAEGEANFFAALEKESLAA